MPGQVEHFVRSCTRSVYCRYLVAHCRLSKGPALSRLLRRRLGWVSLEDPVSHFRICLVQIIVHHSLLKDPGAVVAHAPRQLILGCIQPLPDVLLGVGAPPPQPLLQDLLARRRQEQETRRRSEIGMRLDLLHAVHLNVEHRRPARRGNVVQGLHGRAVVLGAELGVLDEAVGLDERLELRDGGEVVFDAVFLGATRVAGGVGDGKGKGGGVVGEEAVQDGGFAGAGGPAEDDGSELARGCGERLGHTVVEHGSYR